MSSNWPEVRKIVNAALDQPPEERQAYAEQACGTDAALREAVWSLLNDDSVPEGFLEPPIEGAAVHLAAGSVDRAAAIEHMGRYRVTEVIDSGGIGTVYRAVPSDDENAPPVAVKVLKRGMTGEDMQQRFRQEQEVLARLKHRNIARFIDGGVTSGGLLYLVMEFIEGRPIDRFCDQQKLAVSDRLELFEDVCSAVQYSHRNLVVHRDLKPRNILVTHDGVPKLLDFGIAKLLEDGSSGPAVDPTVTANRMITPQYASPEQIKGAPISTATDVYSLGVVLYELLTGHRPYDLRGKARGEILELIGEVDPASPSTQVMQTEEVTYLDGTTTTLTPELVSVARGTDPQSLRRELTGDLDTIVLTAMQKDPDRRYASVERLAEDLRRYRTGLPILARADTFSYRARKFIRRNKAATIAATIAFISLIAGTTGLAVRLKQAQGAQAQLVKESENARLQARRSQRLSDFLQDMLASVSPREKGKEVTVREVLDEAVKTADSELGGDPRLLGSILSTIGDTYRTLDMFEQARAQLDRAYALAREHYDPNDVEIATCLNNLGVLLYETGDYSKSNELHREALSIRERVLGRTSAASAQSLNNLAAVLSVTGAYDESRALFTEALQIRRTVLDAQDPLIAITMSHLASILEHNGEYAAAEEMTREVLDLRRQVYGDEHAETVRTIATLGNLHRAQGKYDEAESELREALSLQRKLHGPNNLDVAETLNNLAVVLRARERHREAASLLRETLDIARALLGEEHVTVATIMSNLGNTLRAAGEVSEAEDLYRRSLEMRRTLLGNDHPAIATALNNLASLLHEKGDYETADALYSECLAIQRSQLGPRHARVGITLYNLASMHAARGNLEQAITSYEEALEILEESLGEQHPRVAKVLHALSKTHYSAGELATAEELSVRALDIRREKLRDDHQDTAHSLSLLGLVVMKRGNASAAQPLLREGLEIYKKTLPPEHARLAGANSRLGECLAALGRHTEAEPLLLESLDRWQAVKGADDKNTVETVRRIIVLYDTWGKPEQAAEYRALLEEATGGDESEEEGDEPTPDAKTELAQDAGEEPPAPAGAEGGEGESP